MCGRAVPLRYPVDTDSRRFPGSLKLNLGVRIARYARFAAPRDDADAPGGAGKVARALALQLAKQTSKFETIN
jgi:hypothetical protein